MLYMPFQSIIITHKLTLTISFQLQARVIAGGLSKPVNQQMGHEILSLLQQVSLALVNNSYLPLLSFVY